MGWGAPIDRPLREEWLTRDTLLLVADIWAAIGTGPDTLILRRDGSIVSHGSGLRGPWRLIDDSTMEIGTVRFRHLTSVRELFGPWRGEGGSFGWHIRRARWRTGTSDVTCTLEIAPVRVRRGDTVEFRYRLDGPAGRRVSARYMSSEEEAFGHSLLLRSESGIALRFLRTPWLSYRLDMTPDSGVTLPRAFLFRFPNPAHGDVVRVVPAADWRAHRTVVDSASAYEATFDAGLQSLPPGEYTVSAQLPEAAVMGGLFAPSEKAVHGASVQSGLECRSTRLTVLP